MATEHQNHAGAEHHPAATSAHSDKNLIAVLAYLWILIVIPFVTPAKDDPFVKFHLKQGLVLIVFEAIGWFFGLVLVWIPIIGYLIVWLWWLAGIIFIIIGIMNVVSGVEKELPYIGTYAKKFTF
jgi:uncharacterized membrane protein